MILEDFLACATFKDDEIVFSSYEQAHMFFKFLHTAILDSHIPVRKCIGYTTVYTKPNHNWGGHSSIDTPDFICKRESRLKDRISITKDMCLCESNVDLNETFMHIIFKNFNDMPILMSDFEASGPMHSEDFQYPQFKSRADTFQYAIEGTGETVHRVTSDMYFSHDKRAWMTNTGSSMEFVMYLWLHEGTGFFDARKSFDYLPKKGEYNINRHWWCFDQHFNISEFVKIKPLPFNNMNIKVNYKYDFTSAALQELLKNWLVRYNNSNLEDEELEWLSSYN